ncbi:sulfatase family protein [Planctomicrobium sp. SH668]|uniref:sulfatase family protein n=1 Tax=Planctomicrobium sp. SH668 TaxID=3448126 RepID=UPI003F5B9529
MAAMQLLSVSIPRVLHAAEPQRPNIVVIFSDDLAWQAISAYGEQRKLLETPQMDRIARKGMRFDRCLVPNSICGPSRAVLLTGKYSHLNGFYNNANSRFDGAQQTFPKLLQQAGYSTALIGKWHLGSDPTGFDHWRILPGQGIYYNPEMIRMGVSEKQPGYVTDIITDLSIDWLNNRDKSKPFLLMCQHKAPHREWSPALRHLGWDNDRDYPEPETLFDDFEGRAQAVKDHDMGLAETILDLDVKLSPVPGMTEEPRKEWNKYYDPRNAAYRESKPTGPDLVRWRYNRYMHDYLGCVKGVDESVGRLLDLLDRENLTENTIVICASDQGFYLGEHGRFDKRWIFEESLRTPLLVRWPEKVKAGSVNDEIVSLIDVAETVLDAAQVAVPEDMQGRSLVPLLSGQTPEDWRKSFYYHYYEYPAPHHVRPHYGVVTDRYKLVRYYLPSQEDEWELLDRQQDPLEVKNFYSDPASAETVQALKQELERLRIEVQETGEPPRAAFGRRPFEGEGSTPQ